MSSSDDGRDSAAVPGQGNGSPAPIPGGSADYELPLAGGGSFRVIPPEQGVPIIRQWLEHNWPMTIQEGLDLRDRLGWTSSPTMETMFNTGHDPAGKDASFVTLKDQVGSFRISLASRIPKANTPEQAPALVQQAYTHYIQALTDLYGAGTTQQSQGRNGPRHSTTWALPSGASLRLGTVGRVLSVTINSPAANRAAQAELRYLEEEAQHPTEPPPRPRTNNT